MNNANLKAKIISILEDRGPLCVSSLAWSAKATSHDAQNAISDLEVEGYVHRHEDGRRYQLSEGYVPPGAA